jgi:hypothetical protein
MSSALQPPIKKLNRYNGIDYDLVGRIGDIARRAFYPQQAAALRKDEVQRLNADLKHIAVKMERINDLIDAATKRAAAAEQKRIYRARQLEPHRAYSPTMGPFRVGSHHVQLPAS